MGAHGLFHVNLRGSGSELAKSLRVANKIDVRSSIGNALRMLGGTLMVLLLSLPAFSQGSAGRSVGTITDQTGGAIGGATVTVADVQRRTTRTLTTHAAGTSNAPTVLR